MSWQKPLAVCAGLGAFALMMPSERSVKKQAFKEFYGSGYKAKLHPTKVSDAEQIRRTLKSFRTSGLMASGDTVSPGSILIRPSGNPLKLDDNLDTWLKENISDSTCEIQDELKLEIAGDMAFTCHREHASFKYQGKANDDIAVWTTVFKKQEGKWKVCHAQRSTGQ